MYILLLSLTTHQAIDPWTFFSFDTSGTPWDATILIWIEIVSDLADESQFRCLIDATRW